MFRQIDGQMVHADEYGRPEMAKRWMEEDKQFLPGDRVIILDKRGYKPDIGYGWDDRMDKLIGRTRTIRKMVINFYGYCVGYRLKNCAGVFSPEFLMRKENKQ